MFYCSKGNAIDTQPNLLVAQVGLELFESQKSSSAAEKDNDGKRQIDDNSNIQAN